MIVTEGRGESGGGSESVSHMFFAFWRLLSLDTFSLLGM